MPITLVRAGLIISTSFWDEVYTVVPYRSDYNLDGVQGCDTGSEFNNNTSIWTPKAGAISWVAQVWAGNFGGAVPNFCLTMFKNGVDFQAALPSAGLPGAIFGGTCSVRCMGFDIANGTDSYQMMLYMTTVGGNPGGPDTDPRLCWFNGVSFGQ